MKIASAKKTARKQKKDAKSKNVTHQQRANNESSARPSAGEEQLLHDGEDIVAKMLQYVDPYTLFQMSCCSQSFRDVAKSEWETRDATATRHDSVGRSQAITDDAWERLVRQFKAQKYIDQHFASMRNDIGYQNIPDNRRIFVASEQFEFYAQFLNEDGSSIWQGFLPRHERVVYFFPIYDGCIELDISHVYPKLNRNPDRMETLHHLLFHGYSDYVSPEIQIIILALPLHGRKGRGPFPFLVVHTRGYRYVTTDGRISYRMLDYFRTRTTLSMSPEEDDIQAMRLLHGLIIPFLYLRRIPVLQILRDRMEFHGYILPVIERDAVLKNEHKGRTRNGAKSQCHGVQKQRHKKRHKTRNQRQRHGNDRR